MIFSREQLNSLYRYALSLSGNPDDAYDLLQSGLEKMIAVKRTQSVNLAYVRTSIRHLFIDQCRRQQIIVFEPLEEEKLAMLSTEPLEQIIINEATVNLLMEDLEPRERECLFLWAVLGYTAAEIANETGESRGTILSRLYRVKKKAQNLLEKNTLSEARSE